MFNDIFWKLANLDLTGQNINLPKRVNGLLAGVPPGPFNGILVVAFDQQIAGSLAAEELARAGAAVIKVEKPSGDPKRSNSSWTAFNTINAGKASISFSNSPEDMDLKIKLLALADVIIDNRSEPAKARDRILQASLQAKRRQPVIYCGISGFGRGKPIPTYDRIVQAAMGMAHLNDGLIPFPLIDNNTGKEAAREISNYLYYRQRMSRRVARTMPCIRLDVSMAAVALNLMANPIATYLDTESAQNTIVPFDLYDAQDGQISVAVATDSQFETLCSVLGADDLRVYATNALRIESREIIEQRLHEVLREKTVAEWLDLFAMHGVSAAAVNTLPEAIKKFGRGVIKSTTDGGLYISGAATSNIFDSNPRIRSAPAWNADHETVKDLVDHLRKGRGYPAFLQKALDIASRRPEKHFQLSYKRVDLFDLKFGRPDGGIDWVKEPFTLRKIGRITVSPVTRGEIIPIIHNEQFMTREVAMDGDVRITTSFGDQYSRSSAYLERHYLPVAGEPGVYEPNPNVPERRGFVVSKNVCFMSPDGEMTYIPAGGYVVEGSQGPYGIHPNNIPGNYEVTFIPQASNSRFLRKRLIPRIDF